MQHTHVQTEMYSTKSRHTYACNVCQLSNLGYGDYFWANTDLLGSNYDQTKCLNLTLGKNVYILFDPSKMLGYFEY